MKSIRTVFTEGALYVTIAAGSPIAEFLISDRLINSRSIAAVSVVAIVAGANALKAFLSQSMAQAEDKPEPIEVIAPAGEPLQVTETQPTEPETNHTTQ